MSASKRGGHLKFAQILYIFLVYFSPANAAGNITTWIQGFSALIDQTVTPSRRPQLGGQNFTSCCVRAVSAVRDNDYTNTSDVTIFTPFLSKQFPCGAQFNGDTRGVSSVQVSYTWCTANCPGFQISRSTNLSQWIQPLVGFILPAVIFCLNVPRRK